MADRPVRRALFLVALVPEAAAAMRAWVEAGHEIAGVWRRGGPRAGSGNGDKRLGYIAPRWSVSAVARKSGLDVRPVPHLSSWTDAASQARQTGADVLISVYFPQVVPQTMLDVFADRAVNLHPAPLPRYRGPAPIHAMILDGTLETDAAMTLHVMTSGLDEGPIISQTPVSLSPNPSHTGMSVAFARSAFALIRDDLPNYLEGKRLAVAQDEASATYFRTMVDDLFLSADQTLSEVRNRCEQFTAWQPLGIVGIPKANITGFGKVLGAPSGAPPDIGLWSIDMDIRDARIRLKRKRPLNRQRGRLSRLIGLVREPA